MSNPTSVVRHIVSLVGENVNTGSSQSCAKQDAVPAFPIAQAPSEVAATDISKKSLTVTPVASYVVGVV